MRYFVDMLHPPTRAQARAIRDLGWAGCAVYTGGPRAAARHTWQQVDGQRYPVRELADIFDFFVPIWVGRNAPWDAAASFSWGHGVEDGQTADADTGACGFGPTSPLGLDVEYGTYQAHPVETLQYILGWVSAVNSAGHPAGVYSDIQTLNALEAGLQVDWKWGAAWVPSYASSSAPVGEFNPAEPPPWDAWQFGGVTIDGVTVDCNSASDTFAGASYG